MRLACAIFLLTALISSASAQTATPAPEAKSATVPITLDHDRIIIDVYIPLSDGSTKRVRGLVDPADPQVEVSKRVATLMNLTVNCDGQSCTGRSPASNASLEVIIGGLKISLPTAKDVTVIATGDSIFPGTSAEIKIPSTALRNHDVLIDYPDREFTIALAGTISFKGVKSKMGISAKTGVIQIPSRIENKNYNLALDLGASISFLSDELFDKLLTAHPQWPQMTGAVGPANLGAADDDEANWKLMRVDRLQYGPLYLTDVAVARLPKTLDSAMGKAEGAPITGLLGASALQNYRVGLDYAHSAVYFDIGRTFKFPDFDVVGLVLRPETDTRFTIVGVAGFDGKPSVPDVQAGDYLVAVDDVPVPDSTLGQVWSMLEGSPGQERKLTIERSGKQFTVAARVQHFLAVPEDGESSGKSGKKK
jgi:hypothetical protein